MRKFFVHYSTGHENIRAIVEADTPRAAMTQIRKASKRATIFNILDVAQMESMDAVTKTAKEMKR